MLDSFKPCKYATGCENLNHVDKDPIKCTMRTYKTCGIAKFFTDYPQYYQKELEVFENVRNALSELELGCGAMMVPPTKIKEVDNESR